MSIGTPLRAAREARSLSASEAAAATRIKVQHIEALERDDFTVFAAAIYARGSIKNYAAYLGLDPTPLLAEYNAGLPPPERPPLVPAAVARPSKHTASGSPRDAVVGRPAPATNSAPVPDRPPAPPTTPAAAASASPPSPATSPALIPAPTTLRPNGEMEFSFDAPAPEPVPVETATAPPPKAPPAHLLPRLKPSAVEPAGRPPSAVPIRLLAALIALLVAAVAIALWGFRSCARRAAAAGAGPAPTALRSDPIPWLIEPPPEPLLLDPFAPERDPGTVP